MRWKSATILKTCEDIFMFILSKYFVASINQVEVEKHDNIEDSWRHFYVYFIEIFCCLDKSSWGEKVRKYWRHVKTSLYFFYQNNLLSRKIKLRWKYATILKTCDIFMFIWSKYFVASINQVDVVKCNIIEDMRRHFYIYFIKICCCLNKSSWGGKVQQYWRHVKTSLYLFYQNILLFQ